MALRCCCCCFHCIISATARTSTPDDSGTCSGDITCKSVVPPRTPSVCDLPLRVSPYRNRLAFLPYSPYAAVPTLSSPATAMLMPARPYRTDGLDERTDSRAVNLALRRRRREHVIERLFGGSGAVHAGHHHARVVHHLLDNSERQPHARPQI